MPNSQRYISILAKIIPTSVVDHQPVQDLISWRQSIKRLNEEYETAKKKKQALNNLLETGKISQSTHDSFDMEIAEAITDIEKQQKAIIQKISAKSVDLEEQIKTLEMLLANFEIQHIAGEVDEEIYQRGMNVLSLGLDTFRHELEAIKDVEGQLPFDQVIVQSKPRDNLTKAETGEQKTRNTVMDYIEIEQATSSEKTETNSERKKESQIVEAVSVTEDKQKS